MSALPLPRPGRTGDGGGVRPDRPGIVHRLDKGTSGCWRWPGRPMPTAIWSTSSRRGAWSAAISRSSPASSGRIGERSRRRRPLGPHPHQDGGDRGREAGPDGLPRHRAQGTGRGAADDPARALSAERPDPPDPGAHGGHRAPRGGRCPLWGAGQASRIGSLLPPRVRAGVHPPGHGHTDGVRLPAPRGPAGLPGPARGPEMGEPERWSAGPGVSSGRSGGLVDADHVGVEGQRGERLLLCPADPPDPDAKALRRRLERRR